MNIKIIRSKKRKKTISARLVNDEIVLRVPAHLTLQQEKDAVEKLVGRIEKSRIRNKLNSEDELKKRADLLNRRYFDGRLKVTSIKYVTNQNFRYGSCTSVDGTIRISYTISKMPSWVQDYVIIHELAHLLQSNHSKTFWELVNQYELAERARGYLMGYEKKVGK